ncbi:uncharacterized protein BO97DRAFT_14148 [Aspergillus homomorphus CBS 101889]|uniref:Uncharacterized protein n=1 Tax=Aspergillus homomorphus (strain CBS 101889) TaxID=1450537 RepID=A0A395IF13_ASPHC|nr:hypothetical protein BO97DRAFT_14148 [Aspergillus homomorphus CBS 101889]RAL17758.1 hypothetical protein BO97DRAFT_14148 [Aspergillus homomorphus CBS 101889]
MVSVPVKITLDEIYLSLLLLARPTGFVDRRNAVNLTRQKRRLALVSGSRITVLSACQCLPGSEGAADEYAWKVVDRHMQRLLIAYPIIFQRDYHRVPGPRCSTGAIVGQLLLFIAASQPQIARLGQDGGPTLEFRDCSVLRRLNMAGPDEKWIGSDHH